MQQCSQRNTSNRECDTMIIIAEYGRDNLATVYVAQMRETASSEKSDHRYFLEFVESFQPPLPLEKKWVLIVSTLFGCPVQCLMCDAGSHYLGTLSAEEIFAQIDFLVRKRFPNGSIPVNKFKIQFARMGEPSFNRNVLKVLEGLPSRYNAPGLIPSLSTIAPVGTDRFFERLLEIKKKRYTEGQFQLQFSIHTTDEKLRDKLMPVKKWKFAQIARYGTKFYQEDDRKITLNFALAEEMPVEPNILYQHFDPDIFLIKITPLNPTYQVIQNRLTSYIDPLQKEKEYTVVEALRSLGYEVIISIGEVEENHIGSNCGQYLMKHLTAKEHIENGYGYGTKDSIVL